MIVKVTVGCGAELRSEVKLSQVAGILIGVPGGKLDAPGNSSAITPKKISVRAHTLIRTSGSYTFQSTPHEIDSTLRIHNIVHHWNPPVG